METTRSFTSQTGNSQVKDTILSDEARELMRTIFNVALNGPISVLGLAVNVINIIIFVKQGFSDSVNINLFSLAVADLGSLLPMLWISICSNPLFQYSDVDLNSVEIHSMTGGLLHSCFVRIAGLITASITFERCVCIALPMKVKDIITPKRTLISIVVIFAVTISTSSLPLFSTYLLTSFNAKRNKTLVALKYSSSTKGFQNISFSCNVTSQVSSFIIVIICTAILVLKLLEKSQWRHKAVAVSSVSDSISDRDRRVMKMVTFISVIFIFCYFPSVVNLMLMVLLSPEYSATGQYKNSYLVSWLFINSIEAINSSVTILVYYNMSSKFKATFNLLFFTTTRFHLNTKTVITKNIN